MRCDASLHPLMQVLNVFGCRALGLAGLSALMSGCPDLRHLNVNGLINLNLLHFEGETVV